MHSWAQGLLGLVLCTVVAVAALAALPNLQRIAIYMHPVSPRLFDVRAQLAKPEAFGLTDTVLVSIAQPGEVHLHGWFVKATPPSGGRAADIMVYLHGNMGDRALEHRVRLYKLLRSHLQMNVLAFDLRGFGDSSGFPNETAMAQDALAVFRWANKAAGTHGRVHIWGHSLGSGIASTLAAELHRSALEEGNASGGHGARLPLPSSLILEAGFTSLADAAKDYPLLWPLRRLPGFRESVEAYICERYSNIQMVPSLAHIPTLLLHGDRDLIIPHSHSERLYAAARKERDNVYLTVFEGGTHKDLVDHPELPAALAGFFETRHVHRRHEPA